jgi:hypothetical protein
MLMTAQAFDGRTSLKVSLNGLHFVGVSAAATASSASSTSTSTASAAAASGRRLTAADGDGGGGATSSSSSSSSSPYNPSATTLVAEAALPQPANYDGGTVGLSYWYYREPELYADDD